MPAPKDKARQTGDIHPPEREERARSPLGSDDAEEGSPGRGLEDEGRAGKGINQAGYLKDQDAPAGQGRP